MERVLEAYITRINQHLDRSETRFDRIERRLDDLDTSASAVHRALALTLKPDENMYGEITKPTQWDHPTAFVETKAGVRPKKVYRGGWANVYWSEYRQRLTVGAVCRNKSECDAAADRSAIVACIRIPDVTEGDGL